MKLDVSIYNVIKNSLLLRFTNLCAMHDIYNIIDTSRHNYEIQIYDELIYLNIIIPITSTHTIDKFITNKAQKLMVMNVMKLYKHKLSVADYNMLHDNLINEYHKVVSHIKHVMNIHPNNDELIDNYIHILNTRITL